MNKYHNRNRIFSPIMTIHDILTLHIISSFIPLFIPFPLSFLFFFSFSPSLPFLLYLPSPSLFSLSSIVKGARYLTIQTSSVIVPGCPNDGEQTYMALFSHAYLLSTGASKRGAALK